jgi:hypothetical protein
MATTHIVFEGGPDIMVDGAVDRVVTALTGPGPFFRLSTPDGRQVSIRAENIAYVEEPIALDPAIVAAIGQLAAVFLA